MRRRLSVCLPPKETRIDASAHNALDKNHGHAMCLRIQALRISRVVIVRAWGSWHSSLKSCLWMSGIRGKPITRVPETAHPVSASGLAVTGPAHPLHTRITRPATTSALSSPRRVAWRVRERAAENQLEQRIQIRLPQIAERLTHQQSLMFRPHQMTAPPLLGQTPNLTWS